MKDIALAQAAEFVAKYEGFSDRVYLCPAGIQTFGYGSLLRHYPDAIFPMTKDQAKVYLEKDLAAAFNILDVHVTAPINLNQSVALASFVYNVGGGNFICSTLLMVLNQLHYSAAADQFLRWDKANGKQLAGLTKRRVDERALFLTPIEGQLS